MTAPPDHVPFRRREQMLELERALSDAKELVARLRAFEQSRGKVTAGPAGESQEQFRRDADPDRTSQQRSGLRRDSEMCRAHVTQVSEESNTACAPSWTAATSADAGSAAPASRRVAATPSAPPPRWLSSPPKRTWPSTTRSRTATRCPEPFAPSRGAGKSKVLTCARFSCS